MKKEPAVIISAVEALVLSAISLLALLLNWEAEVTAGVMAIVAPAIAIITGLVTRSQVSPAVSE